MAIFDFSMPFKKRVWRVKYNGEVLRGLDGFPIEYDYAAEASERVDYAVELFKTSRSCFELVPVVVS